MTKREIMKKAHEIARQMEGHYHARLALGLRLAWKEWKEEKKELTVGTVLVETGTSTDWLPKSQIQQEGDVILIPEWLAKKKRIAGQPISIVKEVKR